MIRDRYSGGDHIHTASGAGMDIAHVGRVICRTPKQNLFLNDVLHVPTAKKNLVSIQKLVADNNAYLEFHCNFFLIMNRERRKLF